MGQAPLMRAAHMGGNRTG